jgi:disulfide bond formation protein DsbB
LSETEFVDAPHRAGETQPVPASETLALVMAGITLLGSLYLSMGMGLNACPLCFYQRTFTMAIVAVLGMGRALRVPAAPGSLSLLVLPAAVGGLGVAIAHSALVWNGTLVCPNGVLGLGPAPVQSLVAYVLLTALLLPAALNRNASPAQPLVRFLVSAVLGGILAVLSVLSSPPIPPYKPTFDAAGKRVLKSCERASAPTIERTIK